MRREALGVLGLCLSLAACGAPQRGGGAGRRSSWRPRSGPALEQLLNVHRAWGAAPSRDGSRVAFLGDAPGVPQAFVLDHTEQTANERAWRRLTTIDDRIHFVRFTPDDRYVFLGRDRGGDENVQVLRVQADGANLVDLSAAPTVKHLFGGLSRDGRSFFYASNARSAGDFDVYLRPVDGGEARRVYQATGHFQPEDLSGDSRSLVLANEHGSFNQDLYLVDVSNPAAPGNAALLTQHQGDVRYESPRFTADGRHLLVLTDKDQDFLGLAVMDLPSGQTRYLLSEAHDVEHFTLSQDGRTVAVSLNVEGWNELRVYTLDEQLALRPGARIDLERAVVGAMELSGDGRALVVSASRANLPNEVYRIDVATGRSARLTQSDHAGLDESQLVEPTLERVRSFDGLEVPLFLYRPRNLAPGERAPVIVNVHGGPEGQSVPSFGAVVQFLVGHGYIVAEPNVRGSTGYGKRYSHLDDVRLRENSVRDLGEVNRWLRSRPDVDGERIAVMGGSYGGYMTLAAITLQPELWAAACDVVGIANFRTFLQRTAPYRRALREAEYGSLERDGDFLDETSPLRRVDRIRAPLMVIHGANDPRVPVGEAEQITEALRRRGQRVEFLRFANEGHGLARRENRVQAYNQLVRFFDSVLGG